MEISYVLRAPNMQNMQCMMMTGPSSVIIGGHQTKVIELEVEHKEVIREVKHIFYLYSKFSLIRLNICILVNGIFFFSFFFYFRKLDFKFRIQEQFCMQIIKIFLLKACRRKLFHWNFFFKSYDETKCFNFFPFTCRLIFIEYFVKTFKYFMIFTQEARCTCILMEL